MPRFGRFSLFSIAIVAHSGARTHKDSYWTHLDIDVVAAFVQDFRRTLAESPTLLPCRLKLHLGRLLKKLDTAWLLLIEPASEISTSLFLGCVCCRDLVRTIWTLSATVLT